MEGCAWLAAALNGSYEHATRHPSQTALHEASLLAHSIVCTPADSRPPASTYNVSMSKVVASQAGWFTHTLLCHH